MSRKDGWLTPMSSFDVEQGDINSGPGGCGVLELVWTDGPGFSLCAAPLELSGPGFHGVERRLGERVEVCVKCWDSNSIGDEGGRQGRIGVNSDGFL